MPVTAQKAKLQITQERHKIEFIQKLIIPPDYGHYEDGHAVLAHANVFSINVIIPLRAW